MSSTKMVKYAKKTLNIILKKPIQKIQRFSKLRRQKRQWSTTAPDAVRINLCSGAKKIPGYCNIDLTSEADLILDLETSLLPIKNNSCEAVVCISAINYFSRVRGLKIIKDCHRVLKPGGIARFATQDLKLIAEKYLKADINFFFQKMPDGRDRFAGETMCDKINSWFYGYETFGKKHCRYVYDFETLALLFKKAGFKNIKQKKYLESQIPNIEKIDNRPEQMFFLEAVK